MGWDQWYAKPSLLRPYGIWITKPKWFLCWSTIVIIQSIPFFLSTNLKLEMTPTKRKNKVESKTKWPRVHFNPQIRRKAMSYSVVIEETTTPIDYCLRIMRLWTGPLGGWLVSPWNMACFGFESRLGHVSNLKNANLVTTSYNAQL